MGRVFQYLLGLPILSCFISMASANCPMDDISDVSGGPKLAGQTMVEPTLCQSTGAGTLTFGMSIGIYAVFFGVTTPDGLWPDGTLNAATPIFYIMDNTCKVLGAYQTNGDCNVYDGGQYIDANYLKYVLTLRSMDSGVGSGYFQFAYANGLYSIGNNHCTCATMSGTPFNSVNQGCKCAFPVGGEPVSKRSVQIPLELEARATTQTKQSGSGSTQKDSKSQQSSSSKKGSAVSKTVTKAQDQTDGTVGSKGHQQAVQAMKNFKAKGGKILSPEKGKGKPARKVAKFTVKKDGSGDKAAKSTTPNSGKSGSSSPKSGGAAPISKGSKKSRRSMQDSDWLITRAFEEDLYISARDALLEDTYDEEAFDLYIRSLEDNDLF